MLSGSSLADATDATCKLWAGCFLRIFLGGVTKRVATRSRTLLRGAPGLTTRNKKLIGAKGRTVEMTGDWGSEPQMGCADTERLLTTDHPLLRSSANWAGENGIGRPRPRGFHWFAFVAQVHARQGF